jgi:hypothetical protein
LGELKHFAFAPNWREGNHRIVAMGRRVRVRYAPRRILITGEHEAEAKAELLRTRHSKIGRFLLRVLGWPVSSSKDQLGPPRPSHQHPVRHDINAPDA